RLPGFVERFQVVALDELSAGQVRRVMRRLATQSERDLGVSFEGTALALAFRLLDRHVRHERFPGKATALLSDCIHDARQVGGTQVSGPDVLDRFIRRTGMPRDLLDDAVMLEPSALRDHFASVIVGQPEAVAEVCRVVETFKAGLADPDRPLATLLFAGPTGVGKTAMAKALAGYFFGAGPEEAPLVRIDMSELQHEGQVHRLIGLGRDEPGPLVQQLREAPFGVVLFDEIEKAHPVFFDLLLTVLDEGILADALGRETDFRGRVLILTTNLGSGGAPSLGFGSDGVRHDISAVRRFFRPEFFNRIDRVVQFGSLDRTSVRAIARIELDQVAKREGLVTRKIRLAYTDALVDWVVTHGFDRDYGARALQRVVEQRVVNVVGRALLRAPELRDATLTVDVRDGEVEVVGI
ncbi:MAG: AAA family ATPase, partial [Myxococcota bacterium]